MHVPWDGLAEQSNEEQQAAVTAMQSLARRILEPGPKVTEAWMAAAKTILMVSAAPRGALPINCYGRHSGSLHSWSNHILPSVTCPQSTFSLVFSHS